MDEEHNEANSMQEILDSLQVTELSRVEGQEGEVYRARLSRRLPVTLSMVASLRPTRPTSAENRAEGDEAPKRDPVGDDEGEGKEKSHRIGGDASSTSVDWYGTEMSLDCLRGMSEQFKSGVALLPRHRNGWFMLEWDEEIGRTVFSEVHRGEVANAANKDDQQYLLYVEAEPDMEEELSKKLVRKLEKGHKIGWSIGGFFNEVTIIYDSKGDVDRIIIEQIDLDHLAMTRSPANPDATNVALLRTKLGAARSKMLTAADAPPAPAGLGTRSKAEPAPAPAAAPPAPASAPAPAPAAPATEASRSTGEGVPGAAAEAENEEVEMDKELRDMLTGISTNVAGLVSNQRSLDERLSKLEGRSTDDEEEEDEPEDGADEGADENEEDESEDAPAEEPERSKGKAPKVPAAGQRSRPAKGKKNPELEALRTRLAELEQENRSLALAPVRRGLGHRSAMADPGEDPISGRGTGRPQLVRAAIIRAERANPKSYLVRTVKESTVFQRMFSDKPEERMKIDRHDLEENLRAVLVAHELDGGFRSMRGGSTWN